MLFRSGHRHKSRESRVSCFNSRKTSRFPLQRVLRPDSPAVIREQCHDLPRNSKGDWTYLGPHERLPEFPVIKSIETPHVVLHLENKQTNTRFPRHCEMWPFFSCRGYRAIPSPLSKLHRRLDYIYATQWAPRDTRRNSRGEWNSLLPHQTRPDSPGEP